MTTKTFYPPKDRKGLKDLRIFNIFYGNLRNGRPFAQKEIIPPKSTHL